MTFDNGQFYMSEDEETDRDMLLDAQVSESDLPCHATVKFGWKETIDIIAAL